MAVVYITAWAISLALFALMRLRLRPDEMTALLAAWFFVNVAGALEPATTKAEALRGLAKMADLPIYMVVGAIKAALAAPVVAAVWAFSQPGVDPRLLWSAPGLLTVGFWVTDVRMIFDVQGRHALATGFKQGVMSLGHLMLALGVLAGAPLVTTVWLSIFVRLLPVIGLMLHAWRPQTLTRLVREAARMLRDPRWTELAAASIIAAVGGSADRILGLRLLPPADFTGYFLVFEVLSKFWVLAYMIAPMLFARQARATGPDRGFLRATYLVIGVAGLGMILVLAGVLAAVPALATRLIGARFGAWSLVMAVAVVIGAWAQVRIVELQGAGRGRLALGGMGLGAIASVGLFFFGARELGAPGLMLAWLLKSLIELAAVYLPSPTRL